MEGIPKISRIDVYELLLQLYLISFAFSFFTKQIWFINAWIWSSGLLLSNNLGLIYVCKMLLNFISCILKYIQSKIYSLLFSFISFSFIFLLSFILIYFISFYFISFYFVLFYFILFYFILLYFIFILFYFYFKQLS